LKETDCQEAGTINKELEKVKRILLDMGASPRKPKN
jgi:hypothetical protein